MTFSLFDVGSSRRSFVPSAKHRPLCAYRSAVVEQLDHCVHILSTQVDKKLAELNTQFFEEELKQFELFDLEKKKGEIFIVGYQHW